MKKYRKEDYQIFTVGILLIISLLLLTNCSKPKELENNPYHYNIQPEILIRGAIIEHPQGKNIPPVSVVGNEPLPWADTIKTNFKKQTNDTERKKIETSK